MRTPTTAVSPSSLSTHDHAAWRGDGPHALHELAVSVFSHARTRGDRLLFVSDDPSPDRLRGLEDLDAMVHAGALQLQTVEETYQQPLDVAAQRDAFVTALDEAVADGYSGICVVADNSRFAAGSDEGYDAWLAWEAAADELQATRAVSGVCFFDVSQVPSQRFEDLAALHPVLPPDFPVPRFRLFVDGGVVHLVGEVDTFCVDQLCHLLRTVPIATPPVIDVSRVDYIDHRALIGLNRLARAEDPIVIQGARGIVRRVWALLDLTEAAVQLA